MELTIKQLRQLIKEELGMKTNIGYLSACIGGDRRYTDTLKVELDSANDQAVLSVFTSGAVGGMDGPGGSYTPTSDYSITVKSPTGASLVSAIKAICSNREWNFKQYGKPSKNFRWVTIGKSGLNSMLAQEAINSAV